MMGFCACGDERAGPVETGHFTCGDVHKLRTENYAKPSPIRLVKNLFGRPVPLNYYYYYYY